MHIFPIKCSKFTRASWRQAMSRLKRQDKPAKFTYINVYTPRSDPSQLIDGMTRYTTLRRARNAGRGTAGNSIAKWDGVVMMQGDVRVFFYPAEKG